MGREAEGVRPTTRARWRIIRGAMSSPQLQAVVVLLSNIADQLERMWIDRDAFGQALFKAGFTPQQIKKISDEAQADPERQRRSREAYAQMRANLLEAGKLAGIEALLADPQPPGKSN